MGYGYEKVLQVQQRCNVSFEEADRALKQAKGDVDSACAIAIRKKNSEKKDGWFKRVLYALSNLFTYRIKIIKNDKIKFNIPMIAVIVISYLYIFVVNIEQFLINSFGILFFIILAIVILTGHTLSLEPNIEKKELIEKIPTDTMTEDTALEVFSEQEVKEDDDGFYSIDIK